MKLKIPLLLIFFTSIAFVVISRSFYSVKYALQRLPGRGFGLVATERINRGELIIRESPLISINTQQSWFRPSDSYSSAKIDKIFNTLSQEDKLLYRSLYQFPNSRSNLESSEDLLAIFRSNAYPTSDVSAGIFPVISRFNSECRPNVHFHSENMNNSIYGFVYAIRDIDKGQELLNCYVGQFLTRLERRTYFETHFGFTCNCCLCSKEGEELEDDDYFRKSISRNIEEVESVCLTISNIDQYWSTTDIIEQQRNVLTRLNIDDDPALQLKLCLLELKLTNAFLSNNNGNNNAVMVRIKSRMMRCLQSAYEYALICMGSEASSTVQLQENLYQLMNGT